MKTALVALRERAKAFWASPRGPYVLSLLLQVALAPWFIHDWDGFVFLRSVEQFLGGTTPYETAAEAPSYIFVAVDWPAPNSWYAYPPGALLLMTPGVLLAKLLGVTDPAALRLALKLPLILGNLALAWVVGRGALAVGASEKAARRARLFVLFNPLLIFVAALWGMFDAWMMAFLLLSALWLHERRPVAAGLAFAAATSVKVFPLFVAPVFLIHALRTLPRPRESARFVGVSAGAFGLLCLPFLLSSPSGFWLQTVGMHLERPIQGFAAVGLPYLPRFASIHFGLDLWPLPPDWVGPALSTLLLVPGLVLAYAYAATGRADLHHLLWASAVTLLVVLLTGKVVNEQYFLMPIALLAVLAHAPGASRGLRWSLRAWTWGGFVAALVVGFHLFTFMPRETARFLLGMSPEEAIYGLGVWAEARLGIPARQFFVLSDVAASVAVVPVFLLSLWIVLPPLREGALHLARHARGPRPLATRAFALGALVLLVAGPAALATATLQAEEARAPPPMPPLGDTLVGVTYYVWWNNPAHLPEVPDGNWERLSTRPASGYYTSNGHRLEADVGTLRDAGLDFIAVSHHGYDHPRYETLAKIARAKGMRFAPLVEPSVLLAEPEARAVGPDGTPTPHLRPTDHAALRVRDLVRVALSTGSDDAFLRLDGARVVFLAEPDLVGLSWDAGSKETLARGVLALHDGSPQAVGRAWGVSIAGLDDILDRYPSDAAAFDADTPIARDYRAALEARRVEVLSQVRAASPEPIHLVAALPAPGRSEAFLAGADGTFSTGIPLAAHKTPTAERAGLLDAWLGQQGRATWATHHHAADDRPYRGAVEGYVLAPAALDGDTQAALWARAGERGTRFHLLVSWNNHFDGTAFEPTVEHGAAPFEAAKARIATLQALPPA